jgi:hypothetical protein
VTLDAGAKSATVALALPRTYAIRGRLVDAMSNVPIVDGVISVEETAELDHQTFATRVVPRKSDARGRFVISPLVAGTYQLVIAAGSGFLATNRSATIVGADLDLGDVTIARARK